MKDFELKDIQTDTDVKVASVHEFLFREITEFARNLAKEEEVVAAEFFKAYSKRYPQSARIVRSVYELEKEMRKARILN